MDTSPITVSASLEQPHHRSFVNRPLQVQGPGRAQPPRIPASGQEREAPSQLWGSRRSVASGNCQGAPAAHVLPGINSEVWKNIINNYQEVLKIDQKQTKVAGRWTVGRKEWDRVSLPFCSSSPAKTPAEIHPLRSWKNQTVKFGASWESTK